MEEREGDKGGKSLHKKKTVLAYNTMITVIDRLQRRRGGGEKKDPTHKDPGQWRGMKYCISDKIILKAVLS